MERNLKLTLFFFAGMLEPMEKKTNAIRILESQNIAFITLSYPWDENHIDAMHVAEQTGLSIEQVFKTIVMRNTEKHVFVFCVPALFDVNIKKVKMLTGSKDIALVKLDEILPLTGYIRGGCSPLGMKKQYPTYIDETALLHETVYVSAGIRGLQIGLSPNNLAHAAEATFADIT